MTAKNVISFKNNLSTSGCVVREMLLREGLVAPLFSILWSFLEERVCLRTYMCLEDLKVNLVEAWDETLMETVSTAVDTVPKHLHQIVKVARGHIE